jgi:putative copper export protein
VVAAFTSPAAAALLRWIGYCAASIVVGVVAFRAISPAAFARSADTLARLVRRAASALLVAAAIRLAQQVLSFASEPSLAWSMAVTLLGTTWGYAWSVQTLGAAVLVGAPALLTRGAQSTLAWIPRLALALSVAVPPAFQGHAISAEQYAANAVVADAVHLIAGGVWMGTLFVLVSVALPRADSAAAIAIVRRFSPCALTGAAVLGATGAFASWLHVRHLPLLWDSLYGRVLLLKLALVGVVVALGAINWKRMTPRLAEAEGTARLTASARREVAVALLVLLATAVLVATPLPNE